MVNGLLKGHKMQPTKHAIACRKWKAKNYERELERNRSRAYTPEEREYRRLKSIEYYNKNKERLAEYRKEYYENNKHKLNKISKEMMLLKNARVRAKQKQIPFDIILEDIIIPEYCPVFPTIKLDKENTETQDNSPSLDRIIPKLGYVKGNICVISHRANSVKSYGTAEEHDQVAEYIRQTSP